MTTAGALMTAAATGLGGTLMTTTGALMTAARAGEAELSAARMGGALLTAAGSAHHFSASLRESISAITERVE